MANMHFKEQYSGPLSNMLKLSDWNNF